MATSSESNPPKTDDGDRPPRDEGTGAAGGAETGTAVSPGRAGDVESPPGQEGRREDQTGTHRRLEEAAAALARSGIAGGGTPVPTPGSDPYLGRVLDDRYRIVQRLGTGGMGAVFIGEHLGLQKKVAIKVVKQELAGNDDVAQRFAREALASARLDHPHVATALDSGTLEEGGAYLVMQLVRGRSLRSYLGDRGPMTWTDACEVGAQVADALAAAHREGIVHRDLKPENLLLEERDGGALHVRVVDFGIARVTSPEMGRKTLTQTITRAGTVVGTPGYMAPEQAMGDVVDERTDLYALGVIVWELVTGRDPYGRRERDVASLIRSQLVEPPPSPDPSVLPPPLEGLLRGLLQVDRNHRPGSAGEVRDALRQIAGFTGPSSGVHAVVPAATPLPGGAGGWATPATVDGEAATAAAAPSGAGTLEPVGSVPPPASSLPPPPRLGRAATIGLALTAFALLVGGGVGVGRWLASGDGGTQDASRAQDPGVAATPPPEGSGTGAVPSTTGDEDDGDGAGNRAEQAAEALEALALDPALPLLTQERITAMLAAERWIDRERAAEWIAAHEDQPGDTIPEWARAVSTFELARGCRDRADAIEELLRVGDPRALRALERIAEAPETGCGPLGDEDCHGCIRAELGRAIAVLRSVR
jgi:serine/threonine-protein kinase